MTRFGLADVICRFFYVTVVVVLSWIWMQGVHEVGHVLAAIASDGTVARVIWYPTAISRTDVNPNPSALFVCWSGPVFGALAPGITIWICRRWMQTQTELKFFAGFCLLANGAYLSIGSLDRVGDAGDLLRLGASALQLWCVGVLFMAAGLLSWHRLGSPIKVLRCEMPVRRLSALVLLLLATNVVQTLMFRP